MTAEDGDSIWKIWNKTEEDPDKSLCYEFNDFKDDFMTLNELDNSKIFSGRTYLIPMDQCK
jgi:hypothetical protein|tara:strand:- start:2334 stop:2516 length:183 start_codon:yes stop_codon:yes gene_type:complete